MGLWARLRRVNKRLPKWSLLPLFLVVFLVGMFAGTFLPLSFGGFSPSKPNKQLPKDLDYATVEQVYDSLRKNFDGQLDPSKLLDGIKKGLAEASGDRYTEFFDSEGTEELESDLNGQFSGIGAELDKKDNNLIILAPLDGFPAQKAGLRPNDIIARINDENTSDLSVEQAVKRIRGEKGSSVKLTIVRDGEVLEFNIVRDNIVLPNVKTEILNGNIGYIRIVRFSKDSASLTEKAAKELKSKNVKGVILDMRSDPGGYLNSAVDIAGLWLDSKKVLDEKRDGTIEKTYNSSSGRDILAGVKTVVLLDEGSASASEILAGALKDHGVATIVGAKSFGKGSVQTVISFDDGSSLKVTIARWYTPNGVNIDKEGIHPDIEVKFTQEDVKAGKDPQKEKALELLK